MTFAEAGPHPEDRVVAFLNTLDVEDATDALADLASYEAWSERPQTSASLGQARALRDHLRAVAAGEPVTGEFRVHVDVVITGTARLDGASVTEEIAAAVAALALEGRWERVKICPADDCRWAFYDRSRNRSRQWCSMQVCGNRAKVRNHRERTRD